MPFNYTQTLESEYDHEGSINQKGIDSYMQRMKKAKEMKDQKQLLED